MMDNEAHEHALLSIKHLGIEGCGFWLFFHLVNSICAND